MKKINEVVSLKGPKQITKWHVGWIEPLLSPHAESHACSLCPRFPPGGGGCLLTVLRPEEVWLEEAQPGAEQWGAPPQAEEDLPLPPPEGLWHHAPDPRLAARLRGWLRPLLTSTQPVPAQRTTTNT